MNCREYEYVVDLMRRGKYNFLISYMAYLLRNDKINHIAASRLAYELQAHQTGNPTFAWHYNGRVYNVNRCKAG